MYGYEGDLWLATTITPPASAKKGAPAVISANANWLLCANMCVAQKASLQLQLAVGNKPVPSGNAGLSAALKALPRHSLPWSVSATVAKKAIRLTVQDPIGSANGVTFFPADPNAFTAVNPQFSAVSHGFQLVVPLSRYSTSPPRRNKL